MDKILSDEEILKESMTQSAIDSNCNVEDFMKQENVIVTSEKREGARKYLKLPFECDLVSYGSNIVASVNENYKSFVKKYIDQYEIYHCFETPNMQVLNDEFQTYGLRVCFMAQYYLPSLKHLKELECPYELRVLEQRDFEGLYTKEWSNALCEERKELDVLGVGAYDGETLVGLAGCSADCDTMWQIGVDVLPEYRRKGIASAITSRLAIEILDRGKVPFYCSAWSNLRSTRNAIKSGFRPAWVELTVKSKEYVDRMNGIK